MARMAEIPEDSRVEGWVAIAGPLVNLGLGIPAALVHLLVFVGEEVLDALGCRRRETATVSGLGECDQATGVCTNPNAADDTTCSDGKCQDGECKGESTGCGCAHGANRAPVSGLLLGLFVALWLPRRRRK